MCVVWFFRIMIYQLINQIILISPLRITEFSGDDDSCHIMLEIHAEDICILVWEDSLGCRGKLQTHIQIHLEMHLQELVLGLSEEVLMITERKFLVPALSMCKAM